MIRIDFCWLLGGYLSLFILFFLFLEFKKKPKLKHLDIDPRFIWQCSVCISTYIDTTDDLFSICPYCGCYNLKNDKIKNIDNKKS
jgi:hypothetical protein